MLTKRNDLIYNFVALVYNIVYHRTQLIVILLSLKWSSRLLPLESPLENMIEGSGRQNDRIFPQYFQNSIRRPTFKETAWLLNVMIRMNCCMARKCVITWSFALAYWSTLTAEGIDIFWRHDNGQEFLAEHLPWKIAYKTCGCHVLNY